MIASGKALCLCGVLLAGALLACSDSPSEPRDPVGSYALASVDGSGLPFVRYEDEGYRLEVSSGGLQVAADSSYEMVVTTREVVDVFQSEYSDTLRGRWSRDLIGTMLFEVNGDNGSFVGNWQGRRITVLLVEEGEAVSLVFQRQ